MLYRGRIDGKWKITANVAELDGLDSVDIFIGGFWQIWR